LSRKKEGAEGAPQQFYFYLRNSTTKDAKERREERREEVNHEAPVYDRLPRTGKVGVVREVSG
jgi:hypothetical protein